MGDAEVRGERVKAGSIIVQHRVQKAAAVRQIDLVNVHDVEPRREQELFVIEDMGEHLPKCGLMGGEKRRRHFLQTKNVGLLLFHHFQQFFAGPARLKDVVAEKPYAVIFRPWQRPWQGQVKIASQVEAENGDGNDAQPSRQPPPAIGKNQETDAWDDVEPRRHVDEWVVNQPGQSITDGEQAHGGADQHEKEQCGRQTPKK